MTNNRQKNSSPYYKIAVATESIAESTKRIDKTLQKFQENLTELNKQAAKGDEKQNSIKEDLIEIKNKYWNLVLIAFLLLALVAGVKEAVKLFPSLAGIF